MQIYGDLSNLTQIFYSSGKSLFPRVTACTGSNPSTIYQFYKYGYMDMIYPDHKLTKLSLFPADIIHTLKTLKQGPIFLNFHTIPPEKDDETGKIYQCISLIYSGYISGNH